MSEGDKPKLEIYLIASYRPLHSASSDRISCPTSTLLRLSKTARLDTRTQDPESIPKDRLLGILTLDPRLNKIDSSSGHKWHMVCFGEENLYLVSEDLKQREILKLKESFRYLKTGAESRKYWIFANDGSSSRLISKDTGEIEFSTTDMVVRSNIIGDGDNMQNSILVHKDILYMVTTQHFLKSLDLSNPTITPDTLFDGELFEDICIFENKVLATTLQGKVRIVGSNSTYQIGIAADEQVSHIRAYNSSLFAVTFDRYKKTLYLYYLAKDFTTRQKIELTKTKDHLRNMAFSQVRGIGILWLNHRSSHLDVVLFNRRKMALVKQTQVDSDYGMAFALAVLKPTSALTTDNQGKWSVHDLILK